MARVLIAEDDADIAALVAESLAGRHDVVHVADGRAALERCRREHFDILIFDIRMPYLTGLEVADQLRHEGLLRWSPLILLTAQPAERYAALGYALGARVYVPKPFSPAELARTVEQLLRSRVRQPGDGASGAMEQPRTVETFFVNGTWRNRVVGGRPLDGVYQTRKAAVRAGSALALRWHVPHHVVYARITEP
ncbi:response regulator transcription factor [Nocardioides dongkuii]|uniref:response regulator transcription factor n=1 Tax=Nocardioides dongkuii TaxID=2760089 RepID=UPI0015FA0AC0|nr:response regulator [Nocardioides dongkuii]